MLTREECEMALKNIALSYDAEYVNECNDEFCQAMKNYIKMLENLIEEHFSNPPLKFEELKEGMLVYDKNIKSWIEIDKTFEDVEKYVSCWSIGWPYEKRFPYEPNRFYRKEVRNVK